MFPFPCLIRVPSVARKSSRPAEILRDSGTEGTEDTADLMRDCKTTISLRVLRGNPPLLGRLRLRRSGSSLLRAQALGVAVWRLSTQQMAHEEIVAPAKAIAAAGTVVGAGH